METYPIITQEVTVTRRGQTTIPQEIRKKPGIREGTRLTMGTENGKIVFSKTPSVFDLAGKSKMTKDEAVKLLDKMREES
jgi:AbrB family looped-hinge helix DNA binding protein